MNLRPYQQELVTSLRRAIASGKRSPCVVSPTGSGKTITFAHIADGAGRKGRRVWILVHRAELVEQTSRTLSDDKVQHGIIAAGYHGDPFPHVQVVSVQTVVRRLDRVAPPDVLIVDECHHAAAGQWQRITQAFPSAVVLGFTATPERLDGRGLGDTFDCLIRGPEVQWLIDNGYLCRPVYYAPPNNLDVSALHVRAGEFDRREVEGAVDVPTITGDAVAHYARHAAGEPAVVFCASVAHAEHVAAAFSAAGFASATIDGTLDRAERRRRVEALASGSIKVLTSCDIISEGFDLPRVSVAILLRPTKSLGLHLQQVGRVLRVSPGKTRALILDHVGNCLRHGLAEEVREWSLEGRPKRSRETDNGPAVRQCPSCYSVYSPVECGPACPECGHEVAKKQRTIEEVAGDLVQLDAAAVARERRRAQGGARSLEDLIAIGRARGMNYPAAWAKKVMAARQRKHA